MTHGERHRSERIGWLRAAVLGANDGIVSTASLVVGVAAAASARQDVLIAGVAGLVAGALSMAAGEYVSVSSQADTEQADLNRERHELATEPQAEEAELTSIYVRRVLAIVVAPINRYTTGETVPKIGLGEASGSDVLRSCQSGECRAAFIPSSARTAIPLPTLPAEWRPVPAPPEAALP